MWRLYLTVWLVFWVLEGGGAGSFLKGDTGQLNEANADVPQLHKVRGKRNILVVPEDSTFTLEKQLNIKAFSKSDGDFAGDFSFRTYLRYTFPNDVGIGKRSVSTLGIDRLMTYTSLISMLESFGFNGKHCLLRSICETAENPVEGLGILGEIVRMILSPGHNTHPDHGRSLHPYTLAERLGRSSGASNCEKAYNSSCPFSFPEMLHAGISTMLDTASHSVNSYWRSRSEL